MPPQEWITDSEPNMCLKGTKLKDIYVETRRNIFKLRRVCRDMGLQVPRRVQSELLASHLSLWTLKLKLNDARREEKIYSSIIRNGEAKKKHNRPFKVKKRQAL